VTAVFSGFGSVVHRVADLDRSVRWYREALGLEPIHRQDDDPGNTIAVLAIGSTMLTLWQLAPGQELHTGAMTGTYVILTTMDVEASRAELLARGASPEPIVDYPPFRLFWVFDPDGNRIELSQISPRPA
jgi:catechol 2,3-dioxygenase-like lactoylglutathione lyase family enzyme